MKCPKCNIEMKIKESKNVLDTSGAEPKLFRKSVLTCRNQSCGNYDEEVEVVRNQLQLSKDSE